MKLTPVDFSKLKFGIFATILMIACGATAVYLSLNATTKAELARSATQTEFNKFDGRLKRLRSEQNEIKQKSEVFSRLQDRGMIGDERRLEWVELLKDIRDERRLIDLQYEIAPQHPLDTSPNGNFAFYASTMDVQLKLLHEEDLVRFLGDLRQRASALIRIRSCDVTRQPRGGSESGAFALLQAECQIDWVTMRGSAVK